MNFFWQIEYENKKKEEGKKVRADKDKVMDMLFSAFEKHQYYNIKDLGKITNQPMVRQLDLLPHYHWIWTNDLQIPCLYLVGLSEGNTERDLHVQRQGALQKHVGAQKGVQTLQRRFCQFFDDDQEGLTAP